MDFLEKDLEQIIYDATEEQLEPLDVRGKKFRQLKIGNYGIADLIFVDRDYSWDLEFVDGKPQEHIKEYGLSITVCELKKDKIGISAFLQALRYCKGISSYLHSRNYRRFNFKILLMGRTIDDSGSFVFMTDLFNNFGDDWRFEGSIIDINFFTYHYNFDGMSFKNHSNYDLINKGF